MPALGRSHDRSNDGDDYWAATPTKPPRLMTAMSNTQVQRRTSVGPQPKNPSEAGGRGEPLQKPSEAGGWGHFVGDPRRNLGHSVGLSPHGLVHPFLGWGREEASCRAPPGLGQSEGAKNTQTPLLTVPPLGPQHSSVVTPLGLYPPDRAK